MTLERRSQATPAGPERRAASDPEDGVLGSVGRLAGRVARTGYGLARTLPGARSAERELIRLQRAALSELGRRLDDATDPHFAALRRHVPPAGPGPAGAGSNSTRSYSTRPYSARPAHAGSGHTGRNNASPDSAGPESAGPDSAGPDSGGPGPAVDRAGRLRPPGGHRGGSGNARGANDRREPDRRESGRRVPGRREPDRMEPDRMEPLRAAMGELLGRSIDYSEAGARQRLYAEVLDRLTPDEARMLATLAAGEVYPVVHVVERAGAGRTGRTLLGNISTLGKAAGISAVDQGPHYVARLAGAGLADIEGEAGSLGSEYEVLLADERVHAVRVQARRPRILRASVRLSRFGAEFWDACDPGPYW